MLKGILFDMDGVLVESEDFICKAAIRFFEEQGITVHPADFRPFIGRGEDKYIGGVAEKYNVDLDLKSAKKRTYEIYDQLVAGKLKPLDGVYEFIQRCKDKGFKLAVATSADEPKMIINLRELKLEKNTFDALVHGLMVTHKKPSPDIYLMAARAIDCNPEECLVIEDAVNGVEAGKHAGAKCLAVTTSFSSEELKEADWVVSNLLEVPEAVLSW